MSEYVDSLLKNLANSSYVVATWSKRDNVFRFVHELRPHQVRVKARGDKVTFKLNKQKIVANINDLEFAARRGCAHHFVFKDFFVMFELWAKS